MNESTDKTSVATTNVACNEPQPIYDVTEEWRPILNWEGIYEVSSKGRVRKIKTGKLLQPYGRWASAHLAISINGVKRSTTIAVSRCVTEAFRGRLVKGESIEHIDGDFHNNALSNLRITRAPNMNDYPELDWRDIPGYENVYKVSNTGLIYSFESNSLIKVCPDQDGYLSLNLYKKNEHSKAERKTWKVHRLVALAFIPNPENKPQIDHIDGDKTNNTPQNLRWTDSKENINNPVTLERRRASIKEYWKDPVNLARRAARNRSPEFLEVLHAAQADPDFRARMREVRRADMRPVVDLTSGINTYYESIKAAHMATAIDDSTIVRACNRYASGDHRVTPFRNKHGHQVTNFWRWATPEEIAAHKQDSQTDN